MPVKKKVEKKKVENVEYEWRFRVRDRAHYAQLLRRARELGGLPAVKYLLVNHSFSGSAGTSGRVRVAINVATGESDVTMTLKSSSHKVPGAGSRPEDFEQEMEIQVSDADTAMRMLEALGLRHAFTLEKLRTVVQVPAMRGELDFDEGPGLGPYVEVECSTLADLRRLAGAMGLEGQGERFSVRDLYQERYGVSKDRDATGDLLFEAPGNLPQSLRTNQREFWQILREQRGQRREALRLRRRLMAATSRIS